MLADGEITVYSIAGEELVSIPGLKKGEIVDLNAVRNEVVILKSGNYAVKALLK